MKMIYRFFRFIQIHFILIRFSIKINVPRAVRMRLAIENLGPIFVKAGQILSTRRDLLPEDIADELAKLQDQVPPFPGEKSQQMVEAALKKKINQVFSEFDIKAMASASIAQVHAATLLDGRSVVVKILRPRIHEKVEQDLDLLKVLARLAQCFKRFKCFKPKDIVNEISRTLQDELDLLREAANASQLRRNFSGSPLLYIPEIYWDYCRSNVLVLERIHGIPIYQINALKDAGFDMKKLAEHGIEVFFTQVFRDSFFHADMHPGNLFVAKENPQCPKYIAVDFGIMGSLSTKDQRYLAENMLAFFKRDYRRVAELHVASGWLPADTRIDQFEGAIRAVCEPMFEKPLKDISFGQLLLRLFQVARRFQINIQPQLILLQKTLLNVEGISRQIYPDLDLWATARPFLEKWLKEQIGVKSFLRRLRENFPHWVEKFPEIPGLIHRFLSDVVPR